MCVCVCVRGKVWGGFGGVDVCGGDSLVWVWRSDCVCMCVCVLHVGQFGVGLWE